MSGYSSADSRSTAARRLSHNVPNLVAAPKWELEPGQEFFHGRPGAFGEHEFTAVRHKNETIRVEGNRLRVRLRWAGRPRAAFVHLRRSWQADRNPLRPSREDIHQNQVKQ